MPDIDWICIVQDGEWRVREAAFSCDCAADTRQPILAKLIYGKHYNEDVRIIGSACAVHSTCRRGDCTVLV